MEEKKETENRQAARENAQAEYQTKSAEKADHAAGQPGKTRSIKKAAGELPEKSGPA